MAEDASSGGIARGWTNTPRDGRKAYVVKREFLGARLSYSSGFKTSGNGKLLFLGTCLESSCTGLVERSKGEEESQLLDGFTVTVSSGRTLSHSGNVLFSVLGFECDGMDCDGPLVSR